MKDMKAQKKTMSRCFTTLAFISGVLGAHERAVAHPLIQYWQNRTGSHEGFSLEPRIGYFNSSTNFEADGSQLGLPSNGTLTQFSFDINASYGLSDDFFLFGRLSLLSTKSQATAAADLSAFGLSDQLIGAAYRLFNSEGGMSFNLQGEVTLPAYSNSSALTGGRAYLGDGSTDITGGFFGEFPLKLIGTKRDLFIELGAAYTYRSNGFSAAVPWNALLKRDPEFRGVMFAAGVQGQVSLKSDIATDNPANISRTNTDRLTGSYGSMVLNGVNPEWIAFRGTLGYKNGSGQTIYATLINPFSGKSIPSGASISVGAALDLSGTTTAPSEELQTARTRNRKLKNSTEFASYDLDAQVTSVNDQMYLVKIDKGSADNIEKGQFFDIFFEGKPLARARVTHLKNGEAALTVIEYYQDHWIEVGSTARRLVQ